MSLTAIIFLLICGWLAVATAMLWGILRITRKHQQPAATPKAAEPSRHDATAH